MFIGWTRQAGGGDTVNCEPILSEDAWNRVQAILESRAKGNAKRADKNSKEPAPALFSGLLRCGCGKSLGSSGGKTECEACGVSVPMVELETVFASDFAELISSIPDLAPALCEPSGVRTIHLSLADLRHRLTVASEKRESIERLLSDRAISRKRFEETHPPVEREIRDLETRIRRLELQLPPAGSGAVPELGPRGMAAPVELVASRPPPPDHSNVRRPHHNPSGRNRDRLPFVGFLL